MMRLTTSSQFVLLCLTCNFLFVGCHASFETPVAFDPNLVHTTKYAIKDDIEMDQASEDSFWLAETMFGTPDDPVLPAAMTDDEDLAKLVSMDHLHKASGPTAADGRGLFRKHCVVCHGVTGDGRGPTAAVQTPYPRDYRMGIYKFKSTPRGSKPTKEDLATRIRNGIDGTIMIKIPELTDPDIEALVDYVIYLSMRGELERVAVDNAMFEGLIEDGDRIINRQFAAKYQSDATFRERLSELGKTEESGLSEGDNKLLEDFEYYEESWGYAEEYVTDIAEAWLEADEEVVPVPEIPEGFVVASNSEEFASLKKGEHANWLTNSVNRGREVFLGKIAACSTCHGKEGHGDGQVNDYDDWTKDWTSRVGLKPEDRDSLIPLLARGAMEPRNAIPRNFSEGIFRGGSAHRDLYLRITQGIDGTPMPAATFVEGEFEAQDVWHLINFIRSLGVSEPSTDSQNTDVPVAQLSMDLK